MIENIIKDKDSSEVSCVEPEDRIALIKFSKSSKRVFSLVEKKTNFTQLKNQILRLNLEEGDRDARPKLALAVVSAVKEFKMAENTKRKKVSDDMEMGSDNEDKSGMSQNMNKKYIVCITNDFREEKAGRRNSISFEKMEKELKKNKINFILIGLDMT